VKRDSFFCWTMCWCHDVPEQSEERLEGNTSHCRVSVTQFSQTLCEERWPVVEKELLLTDTQ